MEKFPPSVLENTPEENELLEQARVFTVPEKEADIDDALIDINEKIDIAKENVARKEHSKFLKIAEDDLTLEVKLALALLKIYEDQKKSLTEALKEKKAKAPSISKRLHSFLSF